MSQPLRGRQWGGGLQWHWWGKKRSREALAVNLLQNGFWFSHRLVLAWHVRTLPHVSAATSWVWGSGMRPEHSLQWQTLQITFCNWCNLCAKASRGDSTDHVSEEPGDKSSFTFNICWFSGYLIVTKDKKIFLCSFIFSFYSSQGRTNIPDDDDDDYLLLLLLLQKPVFTFAGFFFSGSNMKHAGSLLLQRQSNNHQTGALFPPCVSSLCDWLAVNQSHCV